MRVLLILALACDGVKGSEDCQGYTYETFLSDRAQAICTRVGSCEDYASDTYGELDFDECVSADIAWTRERIADGMERGCGTFDPCAALACNEQMSSDAVDCESSFGCDLDSDVLTPGCDTVVAR
jgi:hypothetical protein